MVTCMTWFWVCAFFAQVHASVETSITQRSCFTAEENEQMHFALFQVGKLKKRSTSLNCSLQFIHIPKNAGSSIERWGQAIGQHWGARLFGHQDIHVSGVPCPLEHVPPRLLQLKLASNQKLRKSVSNPYLDAENLFCVKRNPYSRAVSEYSWRLDRFLNLSTKKFRATLTQMDAESESEQEEEQICPGCARYDTCSAAGMNYFLREVLSMIKNKMVAVTVDRCHFLPQVDYMWSGHDQTCKHVLDIDNLIEEFEALLVNKGCDVPESYAQAKPALCGNLSPSDLESDTKALIQDIYRDDFEKLGYVK